MYQRDFWHQQTIEKIRATTYNLEKGHVVSTELDKKSVFEDKSSSNWVTEKFTFPDVKEGSIIEFDYEIRTPTDRSLYPWKFQGQYPRLWSEYFVEVPQFFNYVFLKQGYLPFYLDTSGVVYKKYFSVNYLNIDVNAVQHTWAIKDVPAIKQENYTAAVDNYASKIEFQLAVARYPNGPVDSTMQNWSTAIEKLMKDEDFGKQLNDENNWLKADVKSATDAVAGGFSSARAIYEYVTRSYTPTANTGLYLTQPLKKTYQNKNGNPTDINMLLAAMLKANGFTVNPVILSTRDNGRANDVYPIIDKFNYTITQLKIGDSSWLLDASHGPLAFGRLPPECYNGYARAISKEDPASIDLSADSLKETMQTSVFISNTDNGIGGEFISTLGNAGSFYMRNKIRPNYKVSDYFKDAKKGYLFDVDISNGSIDSLAKPDEPVTIKYDFDFKATEDILYFTPMVSEAIKENPFKSADRLYPVEKPYCEDNTFTLNMEIPKGYRVDELPKPAKVKLNETDGIFEYIIAANAERIQLRCKLVIKKANFLPEDYKTLRDFYTFIVKKEAEQVVFKKL